jgi:hypothetical protein
MKKNVWLITILNFLTCSAFAQLQSHVDERFELNSIVFRLADAEEYVNNQVVNYAADIDAYFTAYKDHPVVQYVKEIREQDEVAYNAISSLSYLLEISNNNIHLKPQTDLDAFFRDEPRWTKETLNQYLKLLNTFYKKTKFKTFYNQHRDLYVETEKRFDELLKNIHSDWFQSFFGKPLGNPSIYISLSNGRSNYALNSYDRSSDYGIIIGCNNVDKEGIPTFINGFDENGNPYFDSNKFLVIVHEFSHHFSNPLVFQYEQEMIGAAEKIFPYVEKPLTNAAYGYTSSTLIEGFNALFTNMYFKEYPTRFEKYSIRYDEDKGFVWMRRAVRFMDNFLKDRNLYPTIEDFLPQLVSFINFCGDNIEQIVFEYNHSNPYIINVFPGLNSVVSADVKEIRVDFSHPMWGSYGTNTLKQPDVVYPPKNGDIHWNENQTTLIIPVKLEKGKSYGIAIAAGICQSSETFPMQKDFEVTFKTE